MSANAAPMRLLPTMYTRSLRETVRIIVVVVAVPLLVPIFMLTVFAHVFASILKIAGFEGAAGYLQYIAPGTLLMAVMLSATAAVSVAVERQTGFYDRMRISPAGPALSNLGRRVADATKLFVFTLVLIVVSAIAGAPVRNWPLLLLLGTVLPTLWGFAYGGIAFSLCLRTGRSEIAEAILPVFFPLLFVSSAFVPVDGLPGGLATIAAANPLTFICDAIRAAYQGQVDSRAIGLSVLSIVILGVITQLMTMAAERKVQVGR